MFIWCLVIHMTNPYGNIFTHTHYKTHAQGSISSGLRVCVCVVWFGSKAEFHAGSLVK